MNRWLLIGLVACGGRPEPIAPLQNHGDSPQLLVEQAKRELASDWPLDYHRPFAQPEVVSHAAAAFLDACRAGDHPSCWYALWLGERTAAPKLVESNCLAGDQPSCRALPS
ncbi:MAG: hypothetical protein JWO36_1303, partial [Myxococcales bacterium]|nr:hypothetical protein [Myxococcales bacterium]